MAAPPAWTIIMCFPRWVRSTSSTSSFGQRINWASGSMPPGAACPGEGATEVCRWLGNDVWYAHGIHFNDQELRLLAQTGTGIAHCPVSNMKLASGVCRVPDMLALGVPVGLAVDGSASNDCSNLLAEIRAAYLLHRLTYSAKAPTGYDLLKMATMGSARLLGRQDEIGSLEAGKAADLFLLNVDLLELAGAKLDPACLLGTVGYARPAELVMVNGRVVVEHGRVLGMDEERTRVRAEQLVKDMLQKAE